MSVSERVHQVVTQAMKKTLFLNSLTANYFINLKQVLFSRFTQKEHFSLETMQEISHL